MVSVWVQSSKRVQSVKPKGTYFSHGNMGTFFLSYKYSDHFCFCEDVVKVVILKLLVF